MSDEDERISIDFPDDVLVRRGLDWSTPGRLERSRAARFGDWYVRIGDDPDAFSQNRDTRFTVGHGLTGLKLAWGLTYWEARRVALAMDDADLDIPLCPGEVADQDPDLYQVVEAVIASALMDHYVFPIDRWLAAQSGPLDHNHHDGSGIT